MIESLARKILANSSIRIMTINSRIEWISAVLMKELVAKSRVKASLRSPLSSLTYSKMTQRWQAQGKSVGFRINWSKLRSNLCRGKRSHSNCKESAQVSQEFRSESCCIKNQQNWAKIDDQYCSLSPWRKFKAENSLRRSGTLAPQRLIITPLRKLTMIRKRIFNLEGRLLASLKVLYSVAVRSRTQSLPQHRKGYDEYFWLILVLDQK